jgi:4-hydroxy-tetrahydrodipicolinate synthase
MVFLKDTCGGLESLKEKIAAIKGTGLSLFNANTATLLDTFISGADGYNGVMANFHIDIYKWMYSHYKTEPELAREFSDILTVAGVAEARAYPVNAKHHLNLTGVPMGIHTRAKDRSILNENARHEIDSLIRMENSIRRKLEL